MTGSSVAVNDLNSEEIERLVPLIAFLGIIVIVGIPGNLCVCLVFWKSHQGSNSKFFIFLLAVADFISCCVVTLEIVNVLHQYTYRLDWLCKLTIFSELWPVMTSGGLLCIISIDRYRKVCHPFGWQITDNVARLSCVVVVLWALMYAWPALILFGVKDVVTHQPNITGTECGILPEYHDTPVSSIYNGILWLTFMTSLSLLTVLYALITKKLFIQSKKTFKKPCNVGRYIPKSQIESTNESVGSETMSTAFVETSQSSQKKPAPPFCNTEPNVSRPRVAIDRSQAAQARTVKSAYVMGIISVVFIASFLPYLILRLLEVLDKTFVENQSNIGRAVYKSVLRCYFLNCAINPIIYCICSTCFRQELIQKLRNLCHRQQ